MIRQFFPILILLMTGCTSVLEVKPYSTYKVGEVRTASVGDAFLEVQKGTVRRVREWVGIANSPDGWRVRDQFSPDFIRKELIFAGLVSNTLSVSYREFRGGLAAPAFFQNLTYDLSVSDEITFQNFKIKILSADNNGIVVKVLSD